MPAGKPQPETTREYSSGGVVYRRNGGNYEFVAVHRARHTDWSLPKGHIEAGETREQAAIREVKEETGLDARIIAPVTEVVYFYRRGRGAGSILIHKTVYHFLMEATSFEFSGPNWEVSESRWVLFPEAQKVLSYRNDREVVRKAGEMLGVSDQ